ncbi:MAG: helix-turn-helix domain-containing protein [Candidatus Howiella sp.]|jgi:DNA-binding Xre family transcriptional regulator
MNKPKSVLELKDHGEIVFKLDKILAERNLTRNALAQAASTRFEVIDKWCRGSLRKIDTDILAKICYALNCQVSDIIEYKL